VIVKLFDYTCKHCRKLHRQLEEACQRYGGQLAIVVLPVPLNSGCNEYIDYNHPDHKLACEYAKLAMAVWRLAPEKFPTFHKWLMGTDPLPPLSEARSRAEEYADAEALKRAEGDDAVGKLLKQAILLFKRCGAGAIPKLILGDKAVRGELRTSQELFRVLERHTGLKPEKGDITD
jgi:protein-disulfide isomerase